MRYSTADIEAALAEEIAADEPAPGTALEAVPTDQPAAPPEAPARDLLADAVVDVALVRQLDDLKERKRSTKENLTELERQIAALEGEVLEMMALAEVDRAPAGGRRMAHIARHTRARRAKDVEPGEFYAAFREAGGDWALLVQPTINANTLSAHVREIIERDGEDAIPEPIRAVCEIRQDPYVGFTGKRPA